MRHFFRAEKSILLLLLLLLLPWSTPLQQTTEKL
jgi:hypothetical protein